MTLGSIFGSVVGPSSSLFTGRPADGTSHWQKLLSERNSGFYQHGSSGHQKGKWKSEKKHAILSALTLLAFLFFLNILQNCIREQSGNRGTVMFAPTGATAPTGHLAKEPGREPEAGDGKETGRGRKSRSLLGVEEEPAGQEGRRQVKFIRNFSAVKNWSRELSQMSERELEDQKLKTLNFPLYWKNSGLRMALPSRVVGGGLRNGTVSQVLRRLRKRERTSSSTEPVRTATTAPTWDYKRPDDFRPSLHIPEPPRNHSHPTRELTPKPQPLLATPPLPDPDPDPRPRPRPRPNRVSTTPRNRRSDYATARPTDYHDYDRYPDPTRDDPPNLSPTDAIGLDLNTFHTFPVYNYYNHRPLLPRDNQTADLAPPTAPEPSLSPSPSPTPTPDPTQIDRVHDQLQTLTTHQPLFHPTKTSALHSKPPQHKYNRPPPHRLPHHPHYPLTNHHPSDPTYTFSPYRKTHDPRPHFHQHLRDDYYPPLPLVLPNYDLHHDQPAFDLITFLWAILTSFAKPLTNLVPAFAKDNHQDARCYDLLLCEAQRASRLMGPTAEALATTVGTLLTWAATEETRQTVLDAINAGRENTCQQQIRDCEDRSGGKSAMTVIAQVMEMKLR